MKYQHAKNMAVLSVLLRPNKIPTCIEHGRTKRTNVLRLKKIPTYIEQDRIKYQQPTHPTNGIITSSNYGRASALTTTTQPSLPNILATKEVLVITGSEIALSWSPVRLEIQSWRPEFHSWSLASDL